MSWSLAVACPGGPEARAQFYQAHEACPAYQASEQHQLVMDEIAEFAGKIADLTGGEMRVSLSSSGHIGDTGIGSLNVQIGLEEIPQAPAHVPAPGM